MKIEPYEDYDYRDQFRFEALSICFDRDDYVELAGCGGNLRLVLSFSPQGARDMIKHLQPIADTGEQDTMTPEDRKEQLGFINEAQKHAIGSAIANAEDNLARARLQKKADPAWVSGNGESIDEVILAYEQELQALMTG